MIDIKIPFNKPFLTGNESTYIAQTFLTGKISGDGLFTRKCHDFFESKYGFKKVLLTTSCTDALEIASLLCDIKPGDEVIMPSYTFVSTANPFVLRGAKIVFCDSRTDHPGMDEDKLEELITPKTKVIVPVHYAGVACDMDKINRLAKKHNLLVVEDAAQAIDSFYTGLDGIKRPLGSLGELAAFSFHETKNITSGEGGLLAINDENFKKRAEIIREKGTNRSAFFRGEVDKYGWVDIGSSFLPSDIIAAFLLAQLEDIEDIQQKRIQLWNRYYSELNELERGGKIRLPVIPDFATNNGHMFYILCENLEQRSSLIAHLKSKGISSVFHYLSLHKSQYYKDKHYGQNLRMADQYTDTLLRLPLFYELTEEQIVFVCNEIKQFFGLN